MKNIIAAISALDPFWNRPTEQVACQILARVIYAKTDEKKKKKRPKT